MHIVNAINAIDVGYRVVKNMGELAGQAKKAKTEVDDNDWIQLTAGGTSTPLLNDFVLLLSECLNGGPSFVRVEEGKVVYSQGNKVAFRVEEGPFYYIPDINKKELHQMEVNLGVFDMNTFSARFVKEE